MKAKVRKLTTAELFYITEKSESDSAETIAEALDVPLNLVVENTPTKKKESTQFSKLIGKTTKAGKKSGVVIMNEQASSYSDATRGSRKVRPDAKSYIHKPLGDE